MVNQSRRFFSTDFELHGELAPVERWGLFLMMIVNGYREQNEGGGEGEDEEGEEVKSLKKKGEGEGEGKLVMHMYSK